ncbi:ParA family protein [Candidatus Cyrtobacter comes]|nr:ParA family protein [Candidatus Cyrtobacter comes]
MNIMSNLYELNDLKNRYKLTNIQISKITGYSISSVKKWFLKDVDQNRKLVPDRAIRLFREWQKNPVLANGSAKVIVISNQKGGCGKTTLSLNFAKMLSMDGNKVLAIDNDTQANLTYTMLGGLNYPPQESSTLLHLGKHIVPSKISDSLYCIGADENLMDIDKKSAIEVLFNFRDGIRRLINEYSFEYVIIDSPPSLGNIFISGLIASDYIVIPVYPETYHMQGLISLMQKIRVAQQPGLSPNLKILGIILNRVNKGTIVTQNIREQLIESFPELVFRNEISQSTAVIESQTPKYSNSIVEYAKIEKRKGEKVSQEFEMVLNEMLDKIKYYEEK